MGTRPVRVASLPKASSKGTSSRPRKISVIPAATMKATSSSARPSPRARPSSTRNPATISAPAAASSPVEDCDRIRHAAETTAIIAPALRRSPPLSQARITPATVAIPATQPSTFLF